MAQRYARVRHAITAVSAGGATYDWEVLSYTHSIRSICSIFIILALPV